MVESTAVLAALRAFPKATSPGASKLHAQHILDAVSGTIAPAAQTCLGLCPHTLKDTKS